MSGICQRCNEARATVHITDTMPEKRERHLCEVCAEKEGIIIKQHHQTTTEILQKFIKHKPELDTTEDLTCPKCRMTFREFQMKGLLGCPHDYEAFGSLLIPLIERAHEGATHHVGKVPVTADKMIHRQTTVLRLRRELDEAIEREDFETAARLRDEIQALESE